MKYVYLQDCEDDDNDELQDVNRFVNMQITFGFS